MPAIGILPYRYFVIDPRLDHDAWVRAPQVRPGNPAVLHHMVVFVLPPGQRGINPADADLLAAYSPGMPPRELPAGTARVRPAGARLLVQAPYTQRETPADYSPVQKLDGPDADGFSSTTVTVVPRHHKYNHVHNCQNYRLDLV